MQYGWSAYPDKNSLYYHEILNYDASRVFHLIGLIEDNGKLYQNFIQGVGPALSFLPAIFKFSFRGKFATYLTFFFTSFFAHFVNHYLKHLNLNLMLNLQKF